jgi:long-chain acyl-CoA synthetase
MAQFETLVELFNRSREKFGSNPLFGEKKDGEYQWVTYEQVGQMIEHFQSALAEMGIGPDDTVAVIEDNSVKWAVGAYATYQRGAKYCPMYTAQQPKDWKYIIGNSDANVVLCANREVYDQIQPLIEKYEHLQRAILLRGDAEHEDHFDNLLEKGAESPAEPESPDKDDLAMLIYTSGTTGNPKGVRLSHWNICSNINAVESLIPIGEDDVSLAFLPWAHSFGHTVELHTLISKGASLGLVEDISKIVQNLSEVRPTLLFSVPRIFNRIYDKVNKQIKKDGGIKQKLFNAALANSAKIREAEQEGTEPSFWVRLKDWFFDKLIFSKVRNKFGGRLKYAFSGGAALSPEVANFIDGLHITVYEGYGLTETSPIATANAPGRRKIGSVGQPIPGVEVSIREMEDYEEGVGEVCIKGPNVMQGYHKLEDETEQVLDDDGTFHSGDLGEIDEDGFLWIIGRVKSQFKLENGKYVVPGPVEEQYKLSPYINQIMIEGTNREYNIALIVPDFESLGEWIQENRPELSDASRDEQFEDERVRELFEHELERWGDVLKPYERARNFGLIDEEFSTENDMQTPTMKLKRRNILKEYGDLIDRLYEQRGRVDEAEDADREEQPA